MYRNQFKKLKKNNTTNECHRIHSASIRAFAGLSFVFERTGISVSTVRSFDSVKIENAPEQTNSKVSMIFLLRLHELNNSM